MSTKSKSAQHGVCHHLCRDCVSTTVIYTVCETGPMDAGCPLCALEVVVEDYRRSQREMSQEIDRLERLLDAAGVDRWGSP